MNALYSIEQDKNRWGYNSDVGFIGKIGAQSEKDREQDQKIEANKEQIEEAIRSLIENERLDISQQEQIDSNKSELEANKLRDDEQQTQIEDTISRLNENTANDELQQQQIGQNTTDIIRIEGEMPTLDMQGTTLVIGQRKDA